MNRLIPVLVVLSALTLTAFGGSGTYGQESAQPQLVQFSLPWATEEKKAPERKTPPAPKAPPAPTPSTPTQTPVTPAPTPSTPTQAPVTPTPAPAPVTPKPPQDSKTREAAGPGWALNCRSQAGEKGLSCRMSQTVVAKNSGRTLTDVAFLVATEKKVTEVLLQLPLGLYLPAGASYQVDENAPQRLSIRNCNRNGCYARAPVSPEIMGALRKGKQLKIDFKDQAKKPITVPLSLEGFAAAYDKIQAL
jgi:invasion protein IalB